MRYDTRIQLIALVGLLVSWIGAGWMMPAINASASEAQLKYTDEASEGAPAPVVIAQSIGVFRGIIVNYLWIRADNLKEEGKFFEAYQIGRWVTTLQPRVAKVWSFQAWNMAYNISVATHTKEERWSWVQKGIRLIREHGIRYNPNDMMLYKELAWHFFHKVQGFTDDAHHYYKQQIAARWHGILGEPPADHADRIEWMRVVAEAPSRTEDLLADRPDVAALVLALEGSGFELNERMLRTIALLDAMETSYLARELRMNEAVRDVESVNELREEIRPFFEPILRLRPVRNAPEYAEAWPALLAHVRKRVLKDDYNMDASYMLICVERRGPLDWRSPAAHSLYWAEIGVAKGLTRYEQADFDQVNTDRIILHSLQNLKRMGHVVYDPVSGEVGWGPDLRFIEAFENAYLDLRERVPYWGRATTYAYVDGYRNFLIDSIRDLYNWGEIEKAEAYYRKLRVSTDPVFYEKDKSDRFNYPLDEFIIRETADRWTSPHVARTDIVTLLVTGFRAGLARNNKKVWETNYKNAIYIHSYFQREHGPVMTIITAEDRMPLPDFSIMMDQAFIQAMLDEGSLIEERSLLWSSTLPIIYNLKLHNYDRIMRPLQAGYARRNLPMPFDRIFPPPAGLEEYRRAQGLNRPEESKKEQIDIERK